MDFICVTCGARRTYSEVGPTTWRRDTCGCDQEREEMRRQRLLKACDERAAKLIADGIRELGLPELYSDATFESAERDSSNSTLLQFLEEWSSNIPTQEKGIFISGETGVGKTYSACCAMRRAFTSGALIHQCDPLDPWSMTRSSALYINVPEWIQMERQAIDGGVPAADLRRIYDTRLLLVDDILPKGVDRPGAFMKERIYALINGRSNRRLPTIITSNYRLSGLSSRLGEPVSDRIAQMCWLFELTGQSRRLSRKEQP